MLIFITMWLLIGLTSIKITDLNHKYYFYQINKEKLKEINYYYLFIGMIGGFVTFITIGVLGGFNKSTWLYYLNKRNYSE